MTRARVAVLGAILAVMFSSGWLSRGWLEDAKELAAVKAAEVVINRERAREADIAAEVTQLLRETVIKERITVQKLQPIIERPIYEIDCIDSDGLGIINGVLQY